MKPSDHDRLLRELLDDEGLENFRRDSLAGALAALRARRLRRVALTAATAGVTLLLALAWLTPTWYGHPARNPGNTGRMPEPQLASLPVTEASRLQPESDAAPVLTSAPAETKDDTRVQLINDEELFALFPGRSMALIGPPGAQQFVFLDTE